MRIDELNWMDVENYLKQDDRLILIIGACEEHGYLSLLTDIKIPQALADAASLKSGVMVAPPLNFGNSAYFLTYPGTISIRASTLMAVIEDLVRSVHRQGFRRLLFLNGHGGNAAARTRLVELMNEMSDLKVAWYEWWNAATVGATAAKHGLQSNHASWIEAFPFVRVTDLPPGVKPEVRAPRLLNADETRQFYGDGVMGGPYQVADEIMDEIFQAALGDIVNLLKFE